VQELVAPSPPQLLSISDNVSGGPVAFPTLITYTLTFDKPMDPTTIGPEDFGNGFSTEIEILTISPTADPAVFEITVTPVDPGVILFEIQQGAHLADLDGLSLDTSFAWSDDTTITIEPTAASPYEAWMNSFEGLNSPDPSYDFDGGGLATAIEWALGGDPTDPMDDLLIVPTLDLTTDPHGKIRFIFRRNAEAAADEATTITAEYGSDLRGWTTAVHQGTGANDITITEQSDGFEPGIDRVTVAVPRHFGTQGKFFIRLNIHIHLSHDTP
jgi:hypothetical protein